LKRGNADRNASLNIGHQLIERTHFQKPSAKSEGVPRSYGIPASSSTLTGQCEQGQPHPEARPSSQGARDR
jgi:hypothetical protein